MKSGAPSGRPFEPRFSNPSRAACSPADNSRRPANRGARQRRADLRERVDRAPQDPRALDHGHPLGRIGEPRPNGNEREIAQGVQQMRVVPRERRKPRLEQTARDAAAGAGIWRA
jgi:hypothetical protein